jgi:tetratricopeptide (TPR) repeat protein
VYSLGAVLYEMLTGQPPFDGQTTLAVLHKVLDEDPIPPRKLNPRIHIDIQTICLKCLEKEKRRRYLNGRELAEDVRRFNAGEPISATPIGFVGSWVRRAKKHLNVTLSVLVGLGIGLAALGYNLVSSSMAERRVEARRYREARSHLRKANKLLHEALDARANLPKHDATKFNAQMAEIRERVKEAEGLFRKAQFNDPDNREAQERLAEVELYDHKLEVERFVFLARNFLDPKPKEGANMAPPPNYPAARAFAEEALSRDPEHKEANIIRRKAIGIRAVTIRTVGGNAQVFARRIADGRGNPIPESTGASKGTALGWTPINNREMFPGLYVLTFYMKSRGAQEATLQVSREADKDPVLIIEIGSKYENMVLMPSGTITTELYGPRKIKAFFIDRFEYPNQAGVPPRTNVSSLAQARSLCRKAGKVLCTAQQWLRACTGDNNNKFPYGRTYRAGWCATGFELGERDKPFPSGWFPRCRTSRGVFDMSGNVSEWTDEEGSEEVIYSGDWLDNVRAPDLFIACRASQLPGVVMDERLGVRCCKPSK